MPLLGVTVDIGDDGANESAAEIKHLFLLPIALSQSIELSYGEMPEFRFRQLEVISPERPDI